METLFEELKRYVGFGSEDEQALRGLHSVVAPDFVRIAEIFYDRILTHEGARTALEGGESVVGRLKVTLVAWMDKLLSGPWDEEYFDLRCRIGRMHVRIKLPQHYMFGAMNILRQQMNLRVEGHYVESLADLHAVRLALGKILDLELAIMLHTFREDLLAQQSRTERLATFGQLVGSLGHELRNPLGVIESSLFILKGRMGADERYDKHINRIGEQVDIASKIISDLLDMIRDNPLTRERLSLADVVSGAIARVSKPDGIVLDVRGLETLPRLQGDMGQLQQVFVNLIENALQATAPIGLVEVVGASPDRHTVEVSITDSGPGVDWDTRQRLFEPLVTTKAKGVGLGLALVKRIMDRHGGQVNYEEAVPRGARFIVRFKADD